MALVTPIQGLIFDVDGTILDTMRPQYLWLKQTAEKYGGKMPHPEFGPDFLKTYNKWYEEKQMPGLYEMIGVDFSAHNKEIWADYNNFNQTHPIRPITGIAEAVKEIFAKSRVTQQRRIALRLGLNTTKSWKDIQVPLANAELLDCLDSIVTKDDLYEWITDGAARRLRIPFDDYKTLRTLLPDHLVRELEKPHSGMSAIAVQRLGINPGAVIAFEDTVAGIQAYKAVLLPQGRTDIYVVGVTWGYQSKDELLAAEPNEIVEKPEELVELVADHGGFSK